MGILIDTNVVSELVARKPNPSVTEWFAALPPQEVYLSVLTIGEIQHGITKLPESALKQQLSEWLQNDLTQRFSGRIIQITEEIALIWGELAGQLARGGATMAAIDSLIAASALAGDHTLATRNVRDFERSGVPIVNPWQLA